MGILVGMRALFPLFVLLVTAQACAPVFSEMQSARMLDQGQMEATALYSNVGFGEDGESDHVQNQLGARVSYGFSDQFNLRFGYENLFEDGGSIHVIGLGAKFPIIQDRIAAFVPIGTALGEDISTADNWQVQPTLLFTVPLGDNFEFNPSTKWVRPFDTDQEGLVAFNFGAGVSSNINQWAIRPEIGLLYNPGESGHFTHYSVGFSFNPFYEDDCCPQKLRRNR
ncbi:MAG: hypothetical protein RJQ09_11005 [Cyclobacteriaceae bacterium]